MGKREQDDSFRGRRRSRSSSRTKSIQEKLLMLSQGQHHLAPKENFTANKRRSLSRDNTKNANKVPLARKDKNHHVSRSDRSRSRSRNTNCSGRLRTKSRSVNKKSRCRSPVRRERSPQFKKKSSQDLSQINNRLFNLVHDQYRVADQNREMSAEKYEFKAKSKKDKKKKKKKKGKKKKDKRALDELNASIAEIEEKTRKATEKEKEERNMRAPMTREMWEKQQSVVRREFDSDTGRVRLVKGGGEILEECVSRDRQREINKQATVGDGQSFQRDIKSRLGIKARLY